MSGMGSQAGDSTASVYSRFADSAATVGHALWARLMFANGSCCRYGMTQRKTAYRKCERFNPIVLQINLIVRIADWLIL